jgi:hypothetical protein
MKRKRNPSITKIVFKFLKMNHSRHVMVWFWYGGKNCQIFFDNISENIKTEFDIRKLILKSESFKKIK